MTTTLSHCRNCGHRLFAWDKFCSQCGQDTLDHPPTLWEFVHEWVLHYLAAEGSLWKSLWALLMRPGFLTLEYLAGRKQRYVLPLRLVLTLGLVFFFAVKLFPPVDEAVKLDNPDELQQVAQELGVPAPAGSAASGAASDPAPRDESTARPTLQLDALKDKLPAGAQQSLEETKVRLQEDPHAEIKRIGNKMLAMAPYAVLVSLPFFAGLLKLLAWRIAYGAHFVFAMHLHAAWYLMLLIVTLTPWGPLHFAIWVWSNLYPLLALKRVHGGGWATTVAKASLLVVLHWSLILIGLLVMLLLGALSR